jgi:hypothetical protein
VEAVPLTCIQLDLQTSTELVLPVQAQPVLHQQSVLLVEVELVFGVLSVGTVGLLMVIAVAAAAVVPAVGAVFLTVLLHRNHAGPVK